MSILAIRGQFLTPQKIILSSMILSNSRRSQRRRYKSALTDTRYSPPKNDFAVNDFANSVHPPPSLQRARQAPAIPQK